MNNHIDQFKTAILEAGLTLSDTIKADGKRHRFDADGRKGKKTGWYTLYLDGLPAGNFGCWRTLPEGRNWCSKGHDTMTEAERQAHARRVADMQRAREEETQARHTEAAAECAKLWQASRPCQGGGHPYLTAKGVKPYGVNIMGKGDAARLLVPMHVGADLVNLQFIGVDGTKRFKTGGQVQGAYCRIGKAQSRVCTLVVCEGYATGASVFGATGHATAVAFNAGNLLAVAKALREKLPQAKIVIAADDDVNTPGNPGLGKATEAARAVGGYLALPDFGSNRPSGVTDFNDLHQLAGLEAVRRCIDAAKPVQGNPDTDTDTGAGQGAGLADGWNPADAEGDGGGDWQEGEPLPAGLPAVPPFPLALLPEAMQGWVADTARRMPCPVDFAAVAVMAVLSSLVGAKVVIYPKQKDTDWKVVPILWAMLIGRPSTKKTPSLSAVLGMFEELEKLEGEKHAIAHEDWKYTQKAQEFQAKEREKTAAKLAKDGADKATIAAALMADVQDEPEPMLRRLKTSDCTMESLQELLMGNQWGMLAVRDELAGWLEGLNRENQQSARAFFLETFNGSGSYTVDRIGRGMNRVIPRLCLSMLGGIQPGKLQNIIREATEGGAGDDGLLQRFQLAVWPDESKEWEYVDREPNLVEKEKARAVFNLFHAIPTPAGDAPAWRFSPQAQKHFVEWITENNKKTSSGDLHPAMEAHLGKYDKLIPALALIFALVDDPQGSSQGEPGTVGEGELLRALAWGEYLEAHAVRIYAAASIPETGGAEALLKRIRAGEVAGEFTTRDLARKGWAQLNTPEALRKACTVLADYQWVRREVRRSGAKGGRPSEVWMVNPYATDADLQTTEGGP